MNQAQVIDIDSKTNTAQFEAFKKRKDKIPFEELAAFFEKLKPVHTNEMIGEWKGGYFKSGSLVDLGLKDYGVWKWIGKHYHSEDNVDALMHRAFGREFNIPFLGDAHIKEVEFRGKVSTGMHYNHLPIVDHFRRVDENTLLGVMDVRGKTVLYFYLYK